MTKSPYGSDIDLTRVVRQSLTEWVNDYDVSGFVAGYIQRYGLANIEDVPSEEYWALMAQYDLTGPQEEPLSGDVQASESDNEQAEDRGAH
jgi:hypothetical protein